MPKGLPLKRRAENSIDICGFGSQFTILSKWPDLFVILIMPRNINFQNNSNIDIVIKGISKKVDIPNFILIKTILNNKILIRDS